MTKVCKQCFATKRHFCHSNGSLCVKKGISCSINLICASQNVLCLASWMPACNTFRHPAPSGHGAGEQGGVRTEEVAARLQELQMTTPSSAAAAPSSAAAAATPSSAAGLLGDQVTGCCSAVHQKTWKFVALEMTNFCCSAG